MGAALQKYLIREDSARRVLGVIGLGGSGGTAMISHAMRSMPIGLPKVLVSTVAGGNVSAYVGCSDLIMFPSIVDVAGINSVSRQILSNAANALAGIVWATVPFSSMVALPVLKEPLLLMVPLICKVAPVMVSDAPV